MQTFTFLEISDLLKEEQQLKKTKQKTQPKTSTVNNIISFSKAYTARKSKLVDYIEEMLN